MQPREQHQGTDCGNDDPNERVTRVRLRACAPHTDLLAGHNVCHEVTVVWAGRCVPRFSASCACLPANGGFAPRTPSITVQPFYFCAQPMALGHTLRLSGLTVSVPEYPRGYVFQLAVSAFQRVNLNFFFDPE